MSRCTSSMPGSAEVPSVACVAPGARYPLLKGSFVRLSFAPQLAPRLPGSTAGRLLVSALLLLGSVRGAAAQLPGPPPQDAVLSAGDFVRITVWRKPELTGEFLVGGDGTVRHPLYQAVRVAGVPIPEVEQRLRSFLSKYETDPQVVIEPLFRVVVGGEVRAPNLLSLSPETTISQAIGLAGGVGERGKLNSVRLVRGRRQYNLDLTSTDERIAGLRVRSGDQILVGRKGNALQTLGPLASFAAAIAAIYTVAKK